MLSIIIPIYNAELYIQNTLDSLVSQTCGDFEVLMIDDGSTDGSYEICKSFAEKDCRFNAYHTESSGVSAARNYGISVAKSEIITFLDSDDYVSNDYCEVIIREMESVDLLVFQTERLLLDEARIILIPKPGIYIGKEDIEIGLASLRANGTDEFGWPWNKAYRKSIITKNNINFPPDVNWYEDEVFALRYAACVNNFKIIDNVLHHYIVRENSLTYSRIPADRIERVADLINQEMDHFSSPSFVSGIKNKIFSFYILSAKAKDSANLMIKRFIKARHFYKKEKKNLTGLGKLSKVIFGGPLLSGLLLFAFFNRQL